MGGRLLSVNIEKAQLHLELIIDEVISSAYLNLISSKSHTSLRMLFTGEKTKFHIKQLIH